MSLRLFDTPRPLSSRQEPVTAEPLSAGEQKMMTQMVCLLTANGESAGSIAVKLGLTESSVEKLLGHPTAQDLVVRMMHAANPEPLQRVKKLANLAIDVQTRLLLSPNTSDTVKAKIAAEMLDRAVGKSIQVVETRNFNFDMSDATAVEKALQNAQEKLARIEATQKKLAPLAVGA